MGVYPGDHSLHQCTKRRREEEQKALDRQNNIKDFAAKYNLTKRAKPPETRIQSVKQHKEVDKKAFCQRCWHLFGELHTFEYCWVEGYKERNRKLHAQRTKQVEKTDLCQRCWYFFGDTHYIYQCEIEKIKEQRKSKRQTEAFIQKYSLRQNYTLVTPIIDPPELINIQRKIQKSETEAFIQKYSLRHTYIPVSPIIDRPVLRQTRQKGKHSKFSPVGTQWLSTIHKNCHSLTKIHQAA